jgi:hypothetical protein
MSVKEVKGELFCCPYCSSDRVSSSNEVENDLTPELKLHLFCLDCGDSYDAIFVFVGRHIVED